MKKTLLESVKLFGDAFVFPVYGIADGGSVVYKMVCRDGVISRDAYTIHGAACSCPAKVPECRHVQMVRGGWDWLRPEPVSVLRLCAVVARVVGVLGLEYSIPSDVDLDGLGTFIAVDVPVEVDGVWSLVGRAFDSLDRRIGLRIDFSRGEG